MTCARCNHQMTYVRDYVDGNARVWVYRCEYCNDMEYVRQRL